MIKGLYTAIVSPFNEKGDFDAEVYRQLVRFQVAAGVDGVTVLGTTGEDPTMHPHEKKEALRITKEETRGRCAMMVGTGSYSTAQTLLNCKIAEEAGADSLLIVTPYYNRPTQEGIYLHYKTISQHVKTPVIVYNHQGRTGQNISTDTLLRIAGLPHLAGVKDASGQIHQIMDVLNIKATYPNFSVLSGVDTVNFSLMALGGDGFISVISNLLPLQLKALANHLMRDQLVEARNLHKSLMPFYHASEVETNPMPIKALLNLAGIPVGSCRQPLCDLLPHNKVQLQQFLRESVVKRSVDENYALYSGFAEVALTR